MSTRIRNLNFIVFFRKFVVFEKAFEAIIQADGTPKELIAPGKLTGYNLLAGLTSGVCAGKSFVMIELLISIDC